jgi:hypothetical protein
MRWIDGTSALRSPIPACTSTAQRRAEQSVYYAGEFCKDAVTGSLEDTAPMFRDLGVDQPAAQRFEPSERAFLVGFHQPRVASNGCR